MPRQSTERSSDSNREDQLLYTRRQVAELYGCTVAYVTQLERIGKLKPFRLTNSPTAQIFFTRENVLAVIAEAVNAR